MSSQTAIFEFVHKIRVVNFVLPILSICVTIFRLFERGLNRRLWWDDAWAAFTMTTQFAFMVIVEIFLQYHVESPNKYPQGVKIAVYYLCAQLFYLVAWSAKMTILFTIIRVTAIGDLRRILVFLAGMFAVTWAVLFSQVWWVCEAEPNWKALPSPQCDLGRNVAIAQIVTDVISDAILIFAPVRLVWRVRLSTPQKIRATAIFSATILSTTVSLYHASWVLRGGGLNEAMAAVIQTAVTLIVANLNVIVAFIFRLGADDKETAPAPLEVKSIVTFGKGDPRTKRSKFGGNVLNTTLLETQDDGAPGSTTIILDTFHGHEQSISLGDTTKMSGDVSIDPTKSTDTMPKVTLGVDLV